MESLYILIPISIMFVFFIGILFWWSTKSGQFDDLNGPGFRVVMDDDSTWDLPEVTGERRDDGKDENAKAKEAASPGKNGGADSGTDPALDGSEPGTASLDDDGAETSNEAKAKNGNSDADADNADMESGKTAATDAKSGELREKA